MYNYKALYDVANGIFAAGKIGEVLNLNPSNDRNQIATTSPIDSICKVLDILAQHAPNEQREILGIAAQKSKLYLDTYTNLDRHFNTYRSSKMNIDKIIETLGIIHPVLGSREKNIIDKILKLYQVLK
ncbi:UNVERIFIED_CONTAM: hypothetical protein Cloal_2731 [Acetivibrio alkalicellulosi]